MLFYVSVQVVQHKSQIYMSYLPKYFLSYSLINLYRMIIIEDKTKLIELKVS